MDELLIMPPAKIDKEKIQGLGKIPLEPLPDIRAGAIRVFRLYPGQNDERICGRVTPSDLEEEPEYEAVSYRWESSTDEYPTIQVNEQTCSIHSNLWDALQAIRHPYEVKVLWVDYLCINQHDDEEKSRQVGHMARIFASARFVHAWLGLSNPLIDETFDAVNQHPDYDFLAGTLTYSDDLARLLYRQYWRRAWIIQEITLARDILFRCGTRCLQEEQFTKLCVWLWENIQGNSDFRDNFDYYSFCPGWALLVFTRARYPKLNMNLPWNHKRNYNATLEQLLVLYSAAQCTIPRDRIYALLAIASDCRNGRGVVPDYSKASAQLICDVFQFCQPTEPLILATRLRQPADGYHLTSEDGCEVFKQNAYFIPPVRRKFDVICQVGDGEEIVSMPSDIHDRLEAQNGKEVETTMVVQGLPNARGYSVKISGLVEDDAAGVCIMVDVKTLVDISGEAYLAWQERYKQQ